MTQYQIIVNPHEVVGRSHSGSRSTSKAVLAVAVLAAVACLAVSGLDSAPASTRASFAEARAVSSPLAKAAHPVPTKYAAVAAKKQLHATSPVMMHAMKQHLALAKQALDEEAAPEDEAPATHEPAAEPAAEEGAPAEPAAKGRDAEGGDAVGDLETEAEGKSSEISGALGFHLENEEKCTHKLANGKCAPQLGDGLTLPPMASFFLIIAVAIPAFGMVVVWAREPIGLEGLMQQYKYKEEEMSTHL
mmetsp:Transcript_82057/g.133133  ORF Transcript_82057/g.133133 Transcript_82057/m.133133 type:complete len:247 (-) Transcript_82057:238-978(-)